MAKLYATLKSSEGMKQVSKSSNDILFFECYNGNKYVAMVTMNADNGELVVSTLDVNKLVPVYRMKI